MNETKSFSRREILAGSASFTALAVMSLSPLTAKATLPISDAGVLVAYFSRSGNTRVVASQIRQACQADIFEIKPATPYPENLDLLVSLTQKETDSGYEPPLAAEVSQLINYHTLFIGLPVWGGTVPAIIRSFLSHHDLTEKILIPFITHGGNGPGNSLSVISEHAPHSTFLKGFTLHADQERHTLTQVSQWMDTLGAIK